EAGCPTAGDDTAPHGKGGEPRGRCAARPTLAVAVGPAPTAACGWIVTHSSRRTSGPSRDAPIGSTPTGWEVGARETSRRRRPPGRLSGCAWGAHAIVSLRATGGAAGLPACEALRRDTERRRRQPHRRDLGSRHPQPRDHGVLFAARRCLREMERAGGQLVH